MQTTQIDISNAIYTERVYANLPVIDTIEATEGNAFIYPDSTNSVEIFDARLESGYLYDNKATFTQLTTNNYYPYVLSSALLYKVNQMIDYKDKTDKKKAQTTDTFTNIKDVRINKILDDWKAAHINNSDYYRTINTLKSPKGYYVGAQGDVVGEYCNLEGLYKQELADLKAVCLAIKNGAKEAAKESDGSSWIKTRTEMTKKGWREYREIKYRSMYNFKLITKETYLAKMSELDNNASDKPKEEEIECPSGNLNKRTIDVVTLFNYGLVINAINKHSLYLKA